MTTCPGNGRSHAEPPGEASIESMRPRRRRRRWTPQWASQCCRGCAADGYTEVSSCAEEPRPACGNGSAAEMTRVAGDAVEPAVEAAEGLSRGDENGKGNDSGLDVPFVGEQPISLCVGTAVILDGYIKPNAMRFIMDLLSGTARTPDIAFHLNPRFQMRAVIRNSNIRGHWGSEECGSGMKFPFTQGELFSIQLFCAEEEFMVAVNGKHFCNFTYRVPLLQIHQIRVSGDLELKSLECKQSDTYPVIREVEKEKLLFALNESVPLSSVIKETMVTTPLTVFLPSKFSEGKTIQVTGKVKLLPYMFYVNLQQGTGIWPHPAIPLHVNPRFGEKGAIVVCNAWLEGKWGLEEKEAIHGLRPAREFTLQIACEPDCYSIVFNGEPVLKFNHRISHKIVDCVLVCGDVWINDVILKETV